MKLYKLKLLLIILFNNTICAQEFEFFHKHLYLDTVITIRDIYTTPVRKVSREVISYSDENFYYFMFYKHPVQLNDTLKIFRIDLGNYSIDSLMCKVKRTRTELKVNSNIPTRTKFIVTNETVYIFYDKYLLSFKKLKNMTFIHDNTVVPKEDFSEIEIFNKQNFVFEELNNPDSYFCIYNYSTHNTDYCKKVPFIAPAFNHLYPHNFFSVKGEKIAFSQAVDYRIDIYNQTGDIISTIKKNDTNWKRISETDIEELRKCEAGIEALNKVLDKSVNISRIYGINFINDSILMVQYYHPVANKQYFKDAFLLIDIWICGKDGKFTLRQQAMADGWDKTDKPLTKNDVPLLIHFYLSGKFECTSDKIMILRNEADINSIGYSQEEYFNYCDKFFETNNPVLKLYVFKHDLAR